MKTVYSFILIFIFSVNYLWAQSVIDCANAFDNLQISIAKTESTCQANGTITVTITGNDGSLTNIECGLETKDDPTGFSINPSNVNVLKNIPPGVYNVIVRAFCTYDGSWMKVKTIEEVKIEGNYVPPVAKLNDSKSRKSYNNCATGSITLNVTNGTGNFKFYIATAPAGVTNDTIPATANGNDYTLNGNYPAGNYEIEVHDGCFKRNVPFTLGAISDYPKMVVNYSYFYPVKPYNSCSLINWLTQVTSGTNKNFPMANNDHQRYYDDGLYEISLSVGTDVPTNWTTWNSTYHVIM